MIDPESTDGGDDVYLSFSLSNPEPTNSTATALVDGPIVTNLPAGPGGLTVISHPADAGPTTGVLCIEVTARGSGFLASANIEVYDPVTLATLDFVGGFPDGTLTEGGSPKWRTWQFGPYARTPWSPVAVKVEQASPTVSDWDARAYSC